MRALQWSAHDVDAPPSDRMAAGDVARIATSPALVRAPLHEYHGGCLCRCLRVTFATHRAPQDWSLQSCSCPFCRRHGALYTCDPRGAATLAVGDPASVRRCEVGERGIEFIACARCGVLVLAETACEDGPRALINVRTLGRVRLDPAAAAAPLGHTAHLSAALAARRRRGWTPLVRSVG